jgi:TolB-like protein/DNA-binding winged helix-turn-helix (wHTH) protein/Tfp pilus assembly protein PilF
MEGTSHDWKSMPAGWRWGDFVLETASRRLLRNGDEVRVEDRVLDLIVLLLQQREHRLDRRQIIEAVWGARPVNDATLRQLVHKARRALDDDGEHQAVIRTVYGRSLQWVAPVELMDEAASACDEAGGTTDAWPEVERRTSSFISPADALPPSGTPASGRAVLPIHSPFRRRAWRIAIGSLLIVLAVGSGAWWWRQPSSSRAGLAQPAMDAIPAAVDARGAVTLAVLPLLDMDAGQDSRYLSDGLTEELINQLGLFPQLRVAARTSSFMFRDQPVDAREAARQLGVGHVLEGSVQRFGKRVRVRVALVSASSGYEVWSNEYDEASGDLLEVEADIAQAVITELRPRLDAHSLARLHGHARIDPAAHDFYLVGLGYLNRRTTADLDRAIAYFQRAIQADPGYASAWSGVATAYALLRDYNSDALPDTHYGDALAAANKAIALDNQLASAHAVLGQLYEEHWQWAPAAREFQRALQLDPSNATIHQWYAMYLWFVGDLPAGLAQMRSAHELDPLSPIINADLGRALLYTGQTGAAVAQYRKALALNPRFALTHVFLAEAYTEQQRYPEALQETRTAISLQADPPSASYLAMLGVALSLVGDQNGARQQQATLESRRRTQYVSGVSMAWLDLQLGDNDKAFANLARAVADHDHLLLPVVAAPGESLHTDPHFVQLLTKMGLPPSRGALPAR